MKFRTTVLTDLYEQTHDIKLTQASAGHTTADMTLKHYVKGRGNVVQAAEVINSVYHGCQQEDLQKNCKLQNRQPVVSADFYEHVNVLLIFLSKKAPVPPVRLGKYHFSRRKRLHFDAAYDKISTPLWESSNLWIGKG